MSRQIAVDLLALPAKMDEKFRIDTYHQEEGHHNEGNHVKEVVSEVKADHCVIIRCGV